MLAVEIIQETDRFLIINKPAGLIVHKPGPQSTAVTLVDWLLPRYPELATVGDGARPGIVHRLDKDTSGLMIIPRDPVTHAAIGRLFQSRAITKTYYALVVGTPPQEGEINFSITRDPRTPTRMTHSKTLGKTAYTRYAVIQQYPTMALIAAYPTTGRTHQIRVHLKAIGHPIIGDLVYGDGYPKYHHPSSLIARQALHAAKLALTLDDISYSFTAPLPPDMVQMMKQKGSLESPVASSPNLDYLDTVP